MTPLAIVALVATAAGGSWALVTGQRAWAVVLWGLFFLNVVGVMVVEVAGE